MLIADINAVHVQLGWAMKSVFRYLLRVHVQGGSCGGRSRVRSPPSAQRLSTRRCVGVWQWSLAIPPTEKSFLHKNRDRGS